MLLLIVEWEWRRIEREKKNEKNKFGMVNLSMLLDQKSELLKVFLCLLVHILLKYANVCNVLISS